MKVITIETHDQILDLIDKPIGTMVNFDWHADYPQYELYILDVDEHANMILRSYPEALEDHWVTILASRGYINKFCWVFPHGYANECSKKFISRNGDCNVYNKRFKKDMVVESKWVTIDMDFFGSRIPVKWEPKDRKELFENVLGTLHNTDDMTLVISKSRRYVNYDVDAFLEQIGIEDKK